MKRIVHHLLVVLFAAVVVGWIFYEPYRPDRLPRAIPAGATFVTEHERLGERLPELVKNPVVASTLLGMGVSEEDVDSFMEDRRKLAWVQRLAGRRCMVAYVPSMGLESRPAWIVTSWVGGGGYRLRALLSVLSIEGFEKIYRHNGRQVWRIEYGGEAEDPVLAATITEGVFIACFSRDRDAMMDVLDYHDGLLAGVSRVPRGPLVRLKEWAKDCPDRGFALLPYTSAWLYRIERFDAHRIHGDLTTEGLHTASPALDAEAEKGELGRLLGNIPLGLAALPVDLVAEVCMTRTGSAFPQIVGTLLNNADADLATLALLGGDYRGTLQNIRVPAFLFAIRMADRTQAEQLAQGLIDQTNGFKKLGLVATPVEASHPLFALESTHRRPYKQFPREDLVAYAMVDNLLVLCSNFGVLENLVNRYPTRIAEFESGQGEWLREFTGQSHQGVLWMNATRSGKAVKETLTAWSLSLLFDATTEERAVIDEIDAAKIWVDRLMPLETVRAWHHYRGKSNLFRIELGPK